jgi:hypothetical protein
MLSPSFTFLHALPDLSCFTFRTGSAGSILVRLRFNQLRTGVYDLSIEQRAAGADFKSFLYTEEDAHGLLATVIQIIELYTDRYPNRIVRLQGITDFQITLFRVLLRVHEELLGPLFSINKEGGRRLFPFRRNTGDSAFLLKRRADTSLPSLPIRASVRTRSRLFGNWVYVELERESILQ